VTTISHAPGRTLAAREPAGASVVHLSLLRGFEIRHGARVIALPHAAERVVAFLALHSAAVRRAHVAGSLWLEADEERANASLRSALWRSRRNNVSIVEAHDGCVSLGTDVAVDVRELEALARRVLETQTVRSRDDVDALALPGDLLPGWYDDWVLAEREYLRHLRLRALECACESLTASGRFVDASEAGLAAVALEPLRESAHRALVKLHLVEGNAAEAVRQYTRFAQLLRSEIGCEPSELMRELVRGLRIR
jgi:DNA-binding SARP family transcriptional activator